MLLIFDVLEVTRWSLGFASLKAAAILASRMTKLDRNWGSNRELSRTEKKELGTGPVSSEFLYLGTGPVQLFKKYQVPVLYF